MTDGTPSGTPERHAQTRLDTLTASPEWSARLLAGDAETVAEFHNLSYTAQGMTPPSSPAPPAGPVSAAVELDALMASKDKDASGRTFAERLNQGEAAAFKQFEKLTGQLAAATDGDWATSNFVPDNHMDAFTGMPLRDMVKAGNSLMARGHSPEAVKSLVDGTAMPTPAQYHAAKHFMARNVGASEMLFDEAAWAIAAVEGNP